MKLENIDHVNKLSKRLLVIKSIIDYLKKSNNDKPVQVFAENYFYFDEFGKQTDSVTGFSGYLKLSDENKKTWISDLTKEHLEIVDELKSLGVDF